MFYVIRYRRDIIIKNIQTAFPEYNDKRVYHIAKESTRHLSDMIFEMIKTITLSKKEMNKRFIITNIDYIRELTEYNRPIFGVTGHYGSFDWTMVIGDLVNMKQNAVYKPIKHKQIDNLLKSSRGRNNASLIPVKKARSFVKDLLQKNKSEIILMIIDQSPKLKRPHYFTTFFNQPTAVFMGFEELARESNGIAAYYKINKIKRGFYKATAIGMNLNCSDTETWKLTDQFYRLLEEHISEQPEYYMWSHKRWKVTLDNAPKILGISPLAQQLIDQQDHRPSSDS
jgi:KDO2-lipid IV(A) lauroyltransferase